MRNNRCEREGEGLTISGAGWQPLALNSLPLKSKDCVEGARRHQWTPRPRLLCRTELFFPPRHFPPNHTLPFLSSCEDDRQQDFTRPLQTGSITNWEWGEGGGGEWAHSCSFKTWKIKRNKRLIYHMSFCFNCCSLSLVVCGWTRISAGLKICSLAPADVTTMPWLPLLSVQAASLHTVSD